MLGDSIHTVKPYFGLGVNSALEDVCVLDACLDEYASLDVWLLDNQRNITFV